MNRTAFSLLVAICISLCGEAVAAPALSKLKPPIACNLLQEIGLGGRGWRNDYDDVYGCSSPYKELGSGHSLANNLAYYVEGKPQSVLQVKLVLNVNVRGQAESAQRELLKAAELLAKRVLGAELPPSVKSALTVGKNFSAEVGGTSVRVIRIDWPTGKGYEVKFVIE